MSLVYAKTCTKCGISKPRNTEFFNLLSSGTWRGTCKKCMAENSRKHHAKNPAMTAKRREEYNQRKLKATGSYSHTETYLLRMQQNDCCAYCGVALNGLGELDHRKSLLSGGTNDISNLAWSCRTCNRDKGSKSVQEFIAWRKKLGLPLNPRIKLIKRISLVKKNSSKD